MTIDFQCGFSVLNTEGNVKSFTTRIPHPADYHQLSKENPTTTYVVRYPNEAPIFIRNGVESAE